MRASGTVPRTMHAARARLAVAVLLLAIGPPSVAAEPLRVSVTGPGTVEAPGVVSCRADATTGCTADVAPGSLTLYARADTGYAIDSWFVEGSLCGPPHLPPPPACPVAVRPGAELFVAVSFRPAARLDVVPSGRGSVTATVETAAPAESGPGGDDGDASCQGGEVADRSCTYRFLPGRTVTLRAAPSPGSRFVRWSDWRCPAAAACVLRLEDSRTTIAAVFSPQRVHVLIGGAGTVTSTPGGLACSATDAAGTASCSAPFERGTRVTLVARPTVPGAGVRWLSPACAVPAGDPTRCVTDVDTVRWLRVSFGGVEPDNAIPPAVEVRLRVDRVGNGRVHGSRVECGARCTADYVFGARETFRAQPDPGWRFTGWSTGCSRASTTCTLSVGPVTSLRATFERQDGGEVRLAATATVTARRVSSGRLLTVRVRLNAPANVRLRLLRPRRARATVARWFRLRSGSSVLRIAVPRTAPAGRYRLEMRFQARGQTVLLSRALRLSARG